MTNNEAKMIQQRTAIHELQRLVSACVGVLGGVLAFCGFGEDGGISICLTILLYAAVSHLLTTSRHVLRLTGEDDGTEGK